MTKNIMIFVGIVLVVVLGVYAVTLSQAAKPTPINPAPDQSMPAPPVMTPVPTLAPIILQSAMNSTLGNYLIDLSGRTLYTLSSDPVGVSTCTGTCAVAWPPYLQTMAVNPMPDNVSLVTRSDGTIQYAWMGHPLYYFKGDTQTGQINGNGINKFGGAWHVVNPDQSVTAPGTTPSPSPTTSPDNANMVTPAY